MAEPGNDFKLIKAGLLIDGTGAPAITDGAVLIRGSQIEAVGPASVIPVPEGSGAQVLDFSGKTLMPGMVDCHTHHNGFGDGRSGDELTLLADEVLTLQSARNARTSLFSGMSMRSSLQATWWTAVRRSPGP